MKELAINTREKWLAAAILFVVAIAAGFAMSVAMKLSTKYSLSQFLPAEHPLLKNDHAARDRFMLDQNQPILITLRADKGDWLETKRLQQLEKATDAVQTLHGTKSAISLATVKTASQNSDSLSVAGLIGIKSEKARRSRVKSDRFLSPMLVSKDLKRALLVVGVHEDITTEQTSALTEELRATLKHELPDARVSIGGVPAIQSQLTALVKTELVRFMGLGLIACCATLLLMFSSLSSIVIPFVAIFATNIFVLAFMSAAGISMSVLAVTIPIICSVEVLSLCIHTMLRYVEDIEKAKLPMSLRWTEKAMYVWTTMRAIVFSNLLTSLTTCLGFGTLIAMKVPLIRDFGIAVAGSVIICWLCSMVVMTALFLILPVPRLRKWLQTEASWADLVFKAGRPMIAGVAIGCVAMALIGRNLHWSARLFDDLPKKEEARRATEEIDRSLGGTIPFEIIIDRGTPEAWNDPHALKSLDKLIVQLRKAPEVGTVNGLPDLLRMALGNPHAKIPATRAAIAESWFLMSMSEASPLKQFMTADGASTRLGLRMRDVPADKMEAAMKRLEKKTRAAFPGAKVSTAGMATTVHTLNNGVSMELMKGFFEALGVITLLLLVVFRSFRWTFMAVLPNLVPAAVLIGVLALAETPIKPSVALVFSIALGIAFNNTVYLLQRLRALMKESGRGPEVEIVRALRLEGNPCFVATLCLMAGFGIFLFSEFGINQTFGIYMLISLFFGLVGDLVFLPALIHLCPWILVSTPKAAVATLEETPAAPVLTLVHSSSVGASEAGLLSAEDAMSHDQDSDSAAATGRRVAAAVGAFFTMFAVGQSAHAALDANVIMKKVEQGLVSKDESATIKMKVVESNGSSKERELDIKRKSGDKHSVLVRLKSPKDVSGIAVLSVMKGGSEDQWLYMPSQHKARRVMGGNKSQKILDTEFSVEDFSAATYAKFANSVMKEERSPASTIAVIESGNKAGGDSTYSRILTWVDTGSYQIQKSEYYDRGGKLLKTMVFRDYKKFGTAWRAQTIEVRNMQTQRSTVLKVAALKVNAGLDDREFTSKALESED